MIIGDWLLSLFRIHEFSPKLSSNCQGFFSSGKTAEEVKHIVERKKFRFYRHVSHNILMNTTQSLPYKRVFYSSKLKSWLYGAIFLQVTSIFNLMSLGIFMLESVTASL